MEKEKIKKGECPTVYFLLDFCFVFSQVRGCHQIMYTKPPYGLEIINLKAWSGLSNSIFRSLTRSNCPDICYPSSRVKLPPGFNKRNNLECWSRACQLYAHSFNLPPSPKIMLGNFWFCTYTTNNFASTFRSPPLFISKQILVPRPSVQGFILFEVARISTCFPAAHSIT